jgi:excisionase family DNA binding protein
MVQATEMFDLDGTARYLKVSRPTVRTALRAGRIPALKLGRRWVVSKDALDRLLGGDQAAPETGQPADATNVTTIGSARR